jgi:hypothetical protein
MYSRSVADVFMRFRTSELRHRWSQYVPGIVVIHDLVTINHAGSTITFSRFLSYAAVRQTWSSVRIYCHIGNHDGRSIRSTTTPASSSHFPWLPRCIGGVGVLLDKLSIEFLGFGISTSHHHRLFLTRWFGNGCGYFLDESL